MFGVAETLFAAVMLSAAFVLYQGLDPKPFAWLTTVAGLVLFQGARATLVFDLTRAPLVTAGIWISAGLAGVLLLPASYLEADSQWREYLLYLIVALLALLAVLSGVMAIESHYGHIAEVAAGG